MKAICGILVLMAFFTACASTPYSPGKPEMSVPEHQAQPKTFNQFHQNWEY